MGIRCLIVDDSTQFVSVAQRLLTRQGMGVVGVAYDVAGALVQVAALCPDVVLVDVGLGPESGFDLARHIAEHAVACRHPVEVILISTHPREDLQELIMLSPAAGYLDKARLSARAIRAVLDRPRQ